MQVIPPSGDPGQGSPLECTNLEDTPAKGDPCGSLTLDVRDEEVWKYDICLCGLGFEIEKTNDLMEPPLQPKGNLVYGGCSPLDVRDEARPERRDGLLAQPEEVLHRGVLSIYIYIYICICVCICIYMYVYIYIYIYICTCVYIQYIHMCVYMYIYIYIDMHYMYTHILY